MNFPGDDPSDGARPSSVEILGVRIDSIRQAELLERISSAIGGSGPPLWIVTANLQHIELAHRDPGMRSLLRRAGIVTADGAPLIWLSRVLRRPLPERVTGSDLILPLAAHVAQFGWRLFLLGGASEVPTRLAQLLREKFPSIQIVGAESPPGVDPATWHHSAAHSDLLARIRQARPDLLLVAFGTPKQEVWIDQHSSAIGARVVIGVGAAFDFLVGTQRRAPRLLQVCGLEWFYRMCRSPKRLVPRYCRIGWTILSLLPRRILRGGH